MAQSRSNFVIGESDNWNAEEDQLLSYFLGPESSAANGNNGEGTTTNSGKRQQYALPPTPAVEYYFPRPVPGLTQNNNNNNNNNNNTNNLRVIPSMGSISQVTGAMALPSTASVGIGASLPVMPPPLPSPTVRPSPPTLTTTSNSSSNNSNRQPIIQPSQKIQLPNVMVSPVQTCRQIVSSTTRPALSLQQQQHQPHHVLWMNHSLSQTTPSLQQQPQPQQQQQHMVLYPIAPTPVVFHSSVNAQSDQTLPKQSNNQNNNVQQQDKRAKRLARNRESARQSRRRKKQHLARLEAKVNSLYQTLETNRIAELNKMDEALRNLKRNRITDLQQQQHCATDNDKQQQVLALMIREMGPNSCIRQTVTSFQFTQLRQFILPKYQEFIMFVLFQPESFFTAGKEEKAKTEKINNSRTSSKQIGEAIATKWKKEIETILSPDEETSLRAATDEPARLWPLFCFEHSISVDQEDKLLHLSKHCDRTRLRSGPFKQVANIARMTARVKSGIQMHSAMLESRNEKLLLNILDQEQSKKFLIWCEKNKDKYKKAASPTNTTDDNNIESSGETSSSLTDLCRRLDQVMTLPPSF